ncbi:MAG TPA: hypothetical protein DCY13_05295, partial [Verrucomicrobiales bacterium]|nr:hypothetical protein [Verrucomicrobiales bacterium]
LALAVVGLASTCLAEYHQKIVRQLELEDPSLPAEVRGLGQPSLWHHPERGPLPDLQLYVREPGGVAWLGGPEGAARFDPSATHPWERWQFFAGQRWLRDNHVRNIVVSNAPAATRVWVRTDSAVAEITWRPMTLAEKAAHYEELIERHHVRHGFVADCRLREPGNLETSFTTDNDNDGLWTAMYLAAQSFRFAVTGDEEARARATRAFDAIVRLLDITGHPGFPARSFVTKDEPHEAGGEWHPTRDGQWVWKGDTSSDEIVGHYYGHALFHDLVADEGQQRTVRRVIAAITDHLLANDFDLLDLDGQPTRWGQWSERYYATEEGKYERALRSLELLAALRVAVHVTGDARYEAAYQERVKRGYAEFVKEYRRWPGGGEINFSDDELAYLSFDPLLRHERDPKLRAIYLDSLRFTWSRIEPDRNPLWNYISAASGAGSLTRTHRKDSRLTLERIPWLPIEWGVFNSRRTDVEMLPVVDRHGRRELADTVAPDERRTHKWNGNPYQADSGTDGRSLECGTYFLLPYWMGRHHGWLKD